MTGLITPEAFPFVDTDPALIASAALDLAGAGRGVGAGGSAVASAWGSLGESYEAPEAGQLLTVMNPVEQITERAGQRMLDASRILLEFADALAAPRRRLRELRTEAEEFLASIAGGFTVDITSADHPAFEAGLFSFMVTDFVDMQPVTIPWDKHQPSIDRNNDLLREVHKQVELVDEARVACVNALRALVSDAVCAPVAIAVDDDQLNYGGMDLPWGVGTRGDRSPTESYGDGIFDSFVAALNGSGELFAFDPYVGPGEVPAFQWDLSEEAWPQLWESLGAIAFSLTLGPQSRHFRAPEDRPQWIQETEEWADQKNQQFVEGLVGTPEEWETNPARAAGSLTFNAGTIGAGATGALLKFGRGMSLFDDVGDKLGATAWVEPNSGIGLTAREVRIIDRFYADALDADPRLKSRMELATSRWPDALTGTQFRTKDIDSLRRKVAFHLDKHPDSGLDLESHLGTINDVHRYTLQNNDAGFEENVREQVGQLRADGFALTEWNNTFGRSGYQGINSTWRSPDGTLFELQFHTPNSFRAKMATHEAYELIRTQTEGNTRRGEDAQRYQNSIFMKVPLPEGARNLTEDSL